MYQVETQKNNFLTLFGTSNIMHKIAEVCCYLNNTSILYAINLYCMSSLNILHKKSNVKLAQCTEYLPLVCMVWGKDFLKFIYDHITLKGSYGNKENFYFNAEKSRKTGLEAILPLNILCHKYVEASLTCFSPLARTKMRRISDMVESVISISVTFWFSLVVA